MNPWAAFFLGITVGLGIAFMLMKIFLADIKRRLCHFIDQELQWRRREFDEIIKKLNGDKN